MVGAHDGLAQDAGRIRVVDGVLDVVTCERVLVADIEHALFGADGERTDDHALDDGMRAAFHRRAVHERTGVTLVAVADNVLGEDVVAGGRAPFAPGGEAGAALAAQARFLNFSDDLVGRHGKRLLQALIAAACDVVVERQRVDDADVLEHDLVLQGIVGVVVHVLVGFAVFLEEELLDGFAFERFDDGCGVAFLHAVVHEVARHEAHDGALLAFARAARAYDADVDFHFVGQAMRSKFAFDGVGHAERAVRDAASAAADEDPLGSVNHLRSPPRLQMRHSFR